MPRRKVNAVRHRRVEEPPNTDTTTPQAQLSYQWAPSTSTVFQIMISLRLSAAIWSPISDCDEVYNYWEPLHFLLYGDGFQTWEYSPEYGIRSYGYILLHYSPARLFQFFFPHTKVTTFFFVRCLLSFISACSDVLFYSSVCQKFGNGVGRLTFCFQAIGAGYFVSSAAFLPSSFTMAMTSFAFASWMRTWYVAAIGCVAISALVGWPFAALLGGPIALDMILFSSKYPSLDRRVGSSSFMTEVITAFLFVMCDSIKIGGIIALVLVLCDSTFYGKVTFAPMNIVLYNIFTSHGPDLYGVAPVSYYVINLFLNWNLVFALSCFTLPIWHLRFRRYYGLGLWSDADVIWIVLAYGGWLVTFFLQPHKEERFMYPVYALMCLSAALTLDSYERLIWTFSWIKKSSKRLRSLIIDTPIAAYVILFAALSISRSFGQYRYYHAPLDVYMNLNERLSTAAASNASGKINVCVGKEWYRFPSSFFLPENAQLQFIKSEFAGLLPKPYQSADPRNWHSIWNATRSIPTDMNDMNKEEASRYVELSKCDYLIDLEDPDDDGSSQHEPNYSADHESWRIVKSKPFLISGKSNSFFRAFYIPVLSEKYCKFGNYNLLQRIGY